MLVREVMDTGPVTATKDEPVRSVVAKMIMRHAAVVPVVDEERHVIGVITIRDIMLPLYPNYGDYIHDNVHARDFEAMEEGYPEVMEKTAGEIMTPNPMTVTPDEPVLKAASYMGLKNLRRIPVVEDGKLVGVVSIVDINSGLFFKQLTS